MCGIAGGVQGVGCDLHLDTHLPAMIAMLAHRGPDGGGIHFDGAAGLAHARLSIIDPAGGRQPMSNDDESVWLSFNGEIFNFIELRDELRRQGFTFRTQSDTEVLLRLYERDGADAVRHLNGQWSFAIWDGRSNTLLLSRDRLGVRPLYYTRVGQGVLFASEIKGLMAHPAVSRELDPAGLDDILTIWTTVPPRTVFKGICELPPGHTLTWRNGAIDIAPHWQMSFPTDDLSDRSAAEHLEQLEAGLVEATRLRLRSDVPVGAYLSGGLDSSVVTALMCAQGQTPHTFSIAFDSAALDESVHQRAVARALGTRHHELRLSHADIAHVFSDVIWHAESPLLRTAPAPMYLLSRLAHDNGCKVVLSGEGADEVLGGYDIFKEAKIRRFWAKQPSSRLRPQLLRRLYPYLKDLHRQPSAWQRAFFHVTEDDLASPFFSHTPRWNSTSRLKLFLSRDLRETLRSHDTRGDVERNLPSDFSRWDAFCQAQYLEAAYLLPGYILSSQGDRMGMAHGVEGRFPFLDPQVVAYASRLPSTLKMKALDDKHLLRRLGGRLLPPSIARRPKQPYRAPDCEPFLSATGATRDYVDTLLSPSQLRRDGIFDPGAVAQLVGKLRTNGSAGTRDNMALVAVLSTQMLVDRFVSHFGKGSHAAHAHTTTADVCRG